MHSRNPFEVPLTPVQRFGLASSLVAGVLLYGGISAPLAAILLAMSLAASVADRGPFVLPHDPPEPDEGGVRIRRSGLWIPFHDIYEVRYCEPAIELIGSGHRRLAKWQQPFRALPLLQQLESGVRAARDATDELHLGREAMSTAQWLDGLERRFRGGQHYRGRAVPEQQLQRILRHTVNRADVRAGAAFALLSEGPRGRGLVRATLGPGSPPLLIAVCSMLSPGSVDAGCLAEATPYLTKEERAAVEMFVTRRNTTKSRDVASAGVEAASVELDAAAGPANTMAGLGA